MALPTPPSPNQPIPNNPFYYPLQDSLVTGAGTALIIGSGITINYTTGVISASGGSPASGIPCSTIQGKGTIIAGLDADLPGSVPIGSNGQVLTVNSASPTGVSWTNSNGIPYCAFTGKGVILVGTALDCAASLTVGPSCCILTADSSTATGVRWASNTAIPCCLINKGVLITGNTLGVPVALPAGSPGQYLTVNTGAPSSLQWSTLPSYIPTACVVAKGALIAGCAFNSPVPLEIGTANQFLRVNPACPTGMQWVTCETIPCACLSGVYGGILVGNSTSFGVLTRGCNGFVLTADSGTIAGVSWQAPSGGSTSATPIALGSVYACTPTAANQGVALGYCALACSVLAPTITCNNVGIGTNAGRALCNACNNILIGNNAGCGVVTGNSNILIGPNAGCDLGANVSGCMLIGRGPIGAGAPFYYLRGSSLGVQFANTILDCNGCRGAVGQALTATTPAGGFMVWSNVALVTQCNVDSMVIGPGLIGCKILYTGRAGCCTDYVGITNISGWWNSNGTSFGIYYLLGSSGVTGSFRNTGLNDAVCVPFSYVNLDIGRSPDQDIRFDVYNESADTVCFHFNAVTQFIPPSSVL